MSFDELTTANCLVPGHNPPCDLDAHGGGPTPPVPCCEDPEFSASNPIICRTDDERCAEAAFAQANPLLCPNSARLILKPSVLIRDPLQQVTYKAVLLNKGKEVALTNVHFSTLNGAVASIGGLSGNLTTVAAGTTQVMAQWAGLSAFGTVQVLATGGCATHKTNFVILIDNSKSMSGAFSAMYATKLHYAKAIAIALIESIDLTKDRAAIYSFNTGASLDQGLSQTEATLTTAISSISPTEGVTNLKAALDAAALYLDGQNGSGETPVIVLISDGENKVGGNPLASAAGFQSSGVILAVGVRAYGANFTLLDKIATGGFFANAYETDEGDVIDWLVGMKGYLCSGQCDVLPDNEAIPVNYCVPYAQLNYTGFVNWDVEEGVVDLCGSGGKPLFDFLPGHGLYVDLAGSSPTWKGHLTSKVEYDFTTALPYTISLKLAGNQREDSGAFTVRVRIGTLVDQVITIDNWLQPFTAYEFDFTPSGDQSAKIEIILETQPAGGNPSYGIWLDEVLLTQGVTEMLNDDFDDEHLTCFNVCGTDECDATNDQGPYPVELEIVDWEDDYFDLSDCTGTLEDGTEFCTAGDPWDGLLPQTEEFAWNIDATGGGIGSGVAGSLGGGKAIHFIGISFTEDPPDRWLLEVSMDVCVSEGGGPDSSLIVWAGEKCGDSPIGVYTRTGGCCLRETVTISIPGADPCQPDHNSSGCLDSTPVPAQIPDASPLTDIEACVVN